MKNTLQNIILIFSPLLFLIYVNSVNIKITADQQECGQILKATRGVVRCTTASSRILIQMPQFYWLRHWTLFNNCLGKPRF